MARLTVEDCLPNVENRFELVLKASARARQLERGAEAAVAWDKDKPTVVALREIAEGILNNVTAEELKKAERPMSFISEEEASEEMAAKVNEEIEEAADMMEIIEEPTDEIAIEEEMIEE